MFSSLKELIKEKVNNSFYSKKLKEEKVKTKLRKKHNPKLPEGCEVDNIDLERKVIEVKCENHLAASEAKMVNIEGFDKKVLL